jgi:hypothetical protein
MTDERHSWITSRINLSWIAAALLLSGLHIAVRHQWPGFTPPASPDKPEWIRIALYSELGAHIVFLGVAIMGVRNRIPCLKTPSYSDDGTLSISSSEPFVSTDPKWGEIAAIVFEFAAYLAIWAWVYRII